MNNETMSNVYQFIVLGAIIGLNVMVFFKTGALSEILIGALVGVMTGLGVMKK
jgi:hypothetical protein